MTRYAVRYPKLYQFLAGYFHQSWPGNHELAEASHEDVVRYFRRMNPADTVKRTTRELEDFLGLELSEEKLHDIVVDDLGANVRAAGLGLTYRRWLEAVLASLKQPAGG